VARIKVIFSKARSFLLSYVVVKNSWVLILFVTIQVLSASYHCSVEIARKGVVYLVNAEHGRRRKGGRWRHGTL